MAYIRERSQELTGFQESAPWQPNIDVQCDFVMVYGIDETMPERVRKFKEKGYVVHLMTGISWGEYQDYLYGEYDGKNHWDESQMDRYGKHIKHGKDVPYMSPTVAFAEYLIKKLKRAVDSGVEAIHMEEPEFWDRGGYSESFKREYLIYYREPWQPPHSSLDTRYKVSKLKAYLYARTISQIGNALKEYALTEYGRVLRFYVPTHSLLNYTQWKIMSPEGALIGLPAVDGYIAQVWTGTSRPANVYEGVVKERTFETAFLEYGIMQELVKGTGRRMWFLHDPIEDNPEYTWEDYRYNYVKTAVASLLHPAVHHYEICPWPRRVYDGVFPRKAGLAGGTIPTDNMPGAKAIPSEYATLLNSMVQMFGDMDQKEYCFDGVKEGVGILMSDSGLFQRSYPDGIITAENDVMLEKVMDEFKDKMHDGEDCRKESQIFMEKVEKDRDLYQTFIQSSTFPNFFGMAMPLLKYGLPVRPVLLDNIRRFTGYFDDYKTLILSYEYMKPESPDVNNALAAWVKSGGTLVYIGDGTDPYHDVEGWWNRTGKAEAGKEGWLWPIRETIRKGARTFSNTLHYMEQYPDYKFGASQAQLYAWMKEFYPALYERVKEKIKEGRWEVQGCMWVEADTNLSGGEALVRQILYGKRFFKEEFGVEVKNLWLPDVFGYTGSLPQLLRRSGCDYFMTQKLSWSEHNKFPHQTFLWEGIDGTEIFTHMLPEDTYNSSLTPRQMKYAENNYIDSGICEEALILFGVGDGGGGPGSLHLEQASRMKNLNGICPVNIDFAQPLFERLEESTRGKLPKWVGELYLERHQGTYTTQAKNKWFNRKMELALRELEFALLLTNHLEDYPKQQLDEIWKEVLLYQFHDIIPGSSIKRVYDESVARYEILLSKVQGMTEDCYKEIAADAALTAFNSLSWERTEIVEQDGSIYEMKVPALGYTKQKAPVINVQAEVGRDYLENEYLRAVFGEDGALVSLFDKSAKRESLSGPSNLFAVYDDLNADCWDIAIEYTDRKPEYFTLEGQKFYVKGAYATCEQCYAYGQSQIVVRIQLGHESKRLEFDIKVEWKENLKMLRTSFETDILAKEASYEIQFGQIKRPNNDNTLWQKAQFEVCGHKWVDLSEADYGVALLNDCKYGYRVLGKVIDMNLLRSQNYPGESADRGNHQIRYALYPHTGDERTGQVHKQAYEFNVPVILQKGEGSNTVTSQLVSGAENVVIETIKKAEDENSCILRLYEPYGATVGTSLQFDKQYTSIYKCNLMEEEEEVIGSGDSLSLKVKPFEIVTLKLK